jgi:urease accessory protein
MRKSLLVVLLSAVSASALAHPGAAAHGLASGLAHPFSGLDHLLAMLAVGLWSWQLGGRARLAGPLVFLLLLGTGGMLGFAGVTLPGLETGVAASVLLLGLLIAFALRLPLVGACAAIGVFALLHGMAHGSELPQHASAWTYAAGFVFASTLLHGAGLALGWVRPLWFDRLAGVALAGAGGMLMWAA